MKIDQKPINFDYSWIREEPGQVVQQQGVRVLPVSLGDRSSRACVCRLPTGDEAIRNEALHEGSSHPHSKH